MHNYPVGYLCPFMKVISDSKTSFPNIMRALKITNITSNVCEYKFIR